MTLKNLPVESNVQGDEKADTIVKNTKAVNRITLTRAVLFADMKKPVLAAVKRNWLERWHSLKSDGDKLRERELDAGM